MEDVELCIQVRLQLCMAILVFQINTFCKNYKGVGSADIDKLVPGRLRKLMMILMLSYSLMSLLTCC